LPFPTPGTISVEKSRTVADGDDGDDGDGDDGDCEDTLLIVWNEALVEAVVVAAVALLLVCRTKLLSDLCSN